MKKRHIVAIVVQYSDGAQQLVSHKRRPDTMPFYVDEGNLLAQLSDLLCDYNDAFTTEDE